MESKVYKVKTGQQSKAAWFFAVFLIALTMAGSIFCTFVLEMSPTMVMPLTFVVIFIIFSCLIFKMDGLSLRKWISKEIQFQTKIKTRIYEREQLKKYDKKDFKTNTKESK